jgi:hypothetical protein
MRFPCRQVHSAISPISSATAAMTTAEREFFRVARENFAIILDLPDY